MAIQDEFPGSNLPPAHESVRQAIQWISARRRERPDARLPELVSEASRQFDLSPKDELALLSLLTEGGEPR